MYGSSYTDYIIEQDKGYIRKHHANKMQKQSCGKKNTLFLREMNWAEALRASATNRWDTYQHIDGLLPFA